MGLSFSKLISSLFGGSKDLSIVMVGLDAAGKTTILYKLKLGEITSTIPTIGFNVESVEYKNTKFNVWDIGGQQKIRHLWRHYYKNVDGVIFVVDSSDAERFKEAKEELQHMMAENELADAMALILANKQDLPNAVSVESLTEELGLYDLKQKWFMQPCCAMSGEGLYEGLDWLSSSLSERS